MCHNLHFLTSFLSAI